MRTVAIIQREIPHYRVRFFEELYAQAKSQGFEILVYTAALAMQTATPAFPYRILPVLKFSKDESCPIWMRGLETAISGSDIVVAPQELQCLNVPYLWAKRARVCKTWIWWGHGYNHQASLRQHWVTTLKEFIKCFMTKRADGLITYTTEAAHYWRQRGFPANRVISYLNTIDVAGFREAGTRVPQQVLTRLRRQYGIEGKHVLLFSGRLYHEKRVDFLLETFSILQNRQAKVALLVLGDGPARRELEDLKVKLGLNNVHFIGAKTDIAGASPYFILAHLLVIPALVGLAIVQGFAFGLPLITTNHEGHGPELEYLTDFCGRVTSFDPDSYASMINDLIKDTSQYEYMREAAYKQGSQLLLEYSAQYFVKAFEGLSGPKLQPTAD